MLHTKTTFIPYNWPLPESDVVFAGIPFVSTAGSFAAPYGPLLVRNSLANMEDFIPEAGINLFEKLKICDIGDIDIVPGSFESTASKIRETISHVREETEPKFWIFIGGDHSISLPVVQELKPKTIVILDAHADMSSDDNEETYSKYNHATWLRHIMPDDAKHRPLVLENKDTDIILIGLKNWSRSAWEFSSEVRIAEPDELASMNLKPPVHLSFDIDVLHPSFIGQTGYPEGSMAPADIYTIFNSVKFNSMDIVEISDTQLPSKSGFIAAQSIKRILAHSLLDVKMKI